jgi:hypothetical protein
MKVMKVMILHLYSPTQQYFNSIYCGWRIMTFMTFMARRGL